MKKIIMCLIVALTIISTTSAAYAASGFAWVGGTVTMDSSDYIFLDHGQTLHIVVEVDYGGVHYVVKDNLGNEITTGYASPTSRKAYAVGAPVGKYNITIACSNADPCRATGIIRNY